MPLNTYAELQASIADFLNRVDDEVVAATPDFIRLAEAQMGRELDHWRMEKRVQIPLTGRYEPVPVDFRKPIRLYVDGANAPLDPATQQHMQDMRARSETGDPCAYAITAGEIEIYPTPTEGTLNLHYIADIEALSDTNVTNWLLSEGPDAYLYGSLLQAAPYLRDDDRMATWTALYSGAVQSLNMASERARYGGQGLRMRMKNG